MKTVKIAVVTTPYEVQIYVAAGAGFHLIERMGKDAIAKRQSILKLLSQSYKQIGFDVDVRHVTATEKLRKGLRRTLRDVILGRIKTTELSEAKNIYINKMCGGAFES